MLNLLPSRRMVLEIIGETLYNAVVREVVRDQVSAGRRFASKIIDKVSPRTREEEGERSIIMMEEGDVTQKVHRPYTDFLKPEAKQLLEERHQAELAFRSDIASEHDLNTEPESLQVDDDKEDIEEGEEEEEEEWSEDYWLLLVRDEAEAREAEAAAILAVQAQDAGWVRIHMGDDCIEEASVTGRVRDEASAAGVEQGEEAMAAGGTEAGEHEGVVGVAHSTPSSSSSHTLPSPLRHRSNVHRTERPSPVSEAVDLDLATLRSAIAIPLPELTSEDGSPTISQEEVLVTPQPSPTLDEASRRLEIYPEVKQNSVRVREQEQAAESTQAEGTAVDQGQSGGRGCGEASASRKGQVIDCRGGMEPEEAASRGGVSSGLEGMDIKAEAKMRGGKREQREETREMKGGKGMRGAPQKDGQPRTLPKIARRLLKRSTDPETVGPAAGLEATSFAEAARETRGDGAGSSIARDGAGDVAPAPVTHAASEEPDIGKPRIRSVLRRTKKQITGQILRLDVLFRSARWHRAHDHSAATASLESESSTSANGDRRSARWADERELVKYREYKEEDAPKMVSRARTRRGILKSGYGAPVISAAGAPSSLPHGVGVFGIPEPPCTDGPYLSASTIDITLHSSPQVRSPPLSAPPLESRRQTPGIRAPPPSPDRSRSTPSLAPTMARGVRPVLLPDPQRFPPGLGLMDNWASIPAADEPAENEPPRERIVWRRVGPGRPAFPQAVELQHAPIRQRGNHSSRQACEVPRPEVGRFQSAPRFPMSTGVLLDIQARARAQYGPEGPHYVAALRR